MTELTPIRRGRCAGAGNWQTQYQALQMTAREAAEIMGKNPSTVRTWLVQGRKKLKEVLEVEYNG